MEEASPIPIEAEVPKHRGQAYSEFEKKLSFDINEKKIPIEFGDYGVRFATKRIPCVSIVFYKQGEPIEDELTAEQHSPAYFQEE